MSNASGLQGGAARTHAPARLAPTAAVMIALFALLAATLIVFALWPGIDLAVSRLFTVDGHFAPEVGLGRVGREFFRITPYALMILLTLAYVLRRFGVAAPFAPSGRATFFIIAAMAIGPGLIVNLGLKDHAHRPRPINVVEFGGPDAFKPWDHFDGACGINCSFASGEASQGFWMLAPALIVPPPVRAAAVAAALVFGAVASFWRVAYGGHFLSDVIVGGLITMIVVVALRRALWPKGEPRSPV